VWKHKKCKLRITLYDNEGFCAAQTQRKKPLVEPVSSLKNFNPQKFWIVEI
jgi:hypothetical protein